MTTNSESLRERIEQLQINSPDGHQFTEDVLALIEAEYQKRENALLDELEDMAEENEEETNNSWYVHWQHIHDFITAHRQDSKKGEEDE